MAYTAHVAPLRHDDPRRATRASRAAAAKAVADACAAHGLAVQIKSPDKAEVERHAAALRAAFEPIGRVVYCGEYTAMQL